MIKCEVEGCDREAAPGRYDMCMMHYKRWYKHGDVNIVKQAKKPSQGWWIHIRSGYVMIKQNGRLTYEHIVLAERALGRSLPEGAQVHHTGEPHENHGFCKLVICPSDAYHKLLHKRMRLQAEGRLHEDC